MLTGDVASACAFTPHPQIKQPFAMGRVSCGCPNPSAAASPALCCTPSQAPPHVFRLVGRALHGSDAHVGCRNDDAAGCPILDERHLLQKVSDPVRLLLRVRRGGRTQWCMPHLFGHEAAQQFVHSIVEGCTRPGLKCR